MAGARVGRNQTSVHLRSSCISSRVIQREKNADSLRTDSGPLIEYNHHNVACKILYLTPAIILPYERAVYERLMQKHELTTREINGGEDSTKDEALKKIKLLL